MSSPLMPNFQTCTNFIRHQEQVSAVKPVYRLPDNQLLLDQMRLISPNPSNILQLDCSFTKLFSPGSNLSNRVIGNLLPKNKTA